MTTFFELSIILVIATIIAGFMRLMKQPLIMGYIITGLFIGPQVFGVGRSTEILSVFSEMGIAILLFIVGLHLNPDKVKNFGKSSFLIGIGQIVLTFILGLYIALFFGFSTIASIYIGLALTFSSTIIVLKLLADKKVLDKVEGRLSIAILLLQDLVAALALVILPMFSTGVADPRALITILAKGIGLIFGLYLVSKFVLPKFSAFFARSQEYLFLFSIGWGFGLASLFNYLGFSVEIGALAAGIALSITPYSQEISSKLKPLRDFFVVMFFIVLGSQINFKDVTGFLTPFLLLLGFVIIIKPLIVMTITKSLGYSKKIGFLTAINMGQISEFSLILILLAYKLGQLDENALSLMSSLGMVSILISTYLINYAGKIYPRLAGYLNFFDSSKFKESVESLSNYDVILFGCNRVGYDFINEFKSLDSAFLAVDFEPGIIKELANKGINCVYGDAEDGEFLESISVGKANMVISTIPDYDTNIFLLRKIRETNKRSSVIVISYNIDDAIELYAADASYVIMPHFISGQVASEFARDMTSTISLSDIHKKRTSHIKYLQERKKHGHAHPHWEHHL